MKKLIYNKTFRKIALPLLKTFSFDTHIKHHWTGDKFKLNTYLHKGYWLYGKKREKETLDLYRELIETGNTVIEIGGHIGYFSLYYASLVGNKGKVVVFEPGTNNLPYIRNNVEKFSNITLVEKAVGNENNKEVTFYMDNITGQNNSMLKEFEGLKANLEYAMDNDAKVTDVQVEMITLDSFCEGRNITPDFIKIDVEGFEYEVLVGIEKTLEDDKPLLMVEVQKNQELIYDFFTKKGYVLYNIRREKVTRDYLKNCLVQNIFCFHEKIHKNILNRLI